MQLLVKLLSTFYYFFPEIKDRESNKKYNNIFVQFSKFRFLKYIEIQEITEQFSLL